MNNTNVLFLIFMCPSALFFANVEFDKLIEKENLDNSYKQEFMSLLCSFILFHVIAAQFCIIDAFWA